MRNRTTASSATRADHSTDGFTLIEVSIVLVIIGLVAGGVFVARDLIASANIRTTVSAKQEYDVAVYTFLSKYQYLPGDIRDASLIMGATPRTGTNGNSDGDFLIEPGGHTYDPRYINPCGEMLTFWSDLFHAGLAVTGGGAAPGTAYPNCLPVATTPENGLAAYIPESGWSADTFWLIGRPDVLNASWAIHRPRQHFYMLLQISSVSTNGILPQGNDISIPSWAARDIDTKIDDGYPLTGKVTSRVKSNYASGTLFVLGGASTCYTGTTYLLQNGYGCSLGFETAW
jgi:prepilin-type N-terminal cleavage/methylation domain-containing protein